MVVHVQEEAAFFMARKLKGETGPGSNCSFLDCVSEGPIDFHQTPLPEDPTTLPGELQAGGQPFSTRSIGGHLEAHWPVAVFSSRADSFSGCTRYVRERDSFGYYSGYTASSLSVP